MTQARQGDVLVRRLPEEDTNFIGLKRAPKNRVKKGRFVLVNGEKTGHTHTIEADAIEEMLADAWKRGSDPAHMYMKLKSQATLQHPEHASITLPPGTYKVTRQTEYDPAMGRQVVLD